MIDERKFFVNHFDTHRISDENIQRYSEAHMHLLATNDPDGRYSVMLEEIAEAHEAYFGSTVDEVVKEAVKQGITIRKDAALDRFRKSVRRGEGLVRGNYGKDSSEYEEFFPYGLTEYDKANLANVGTLMARMVAAGDKHRAVLGDDFVREFEDIQVEFTDVRKRQLEKKGEVVESKADTAATRDVLEARLMKNLLFIAADNIGHPERASQFFDLSIL